MRYRLRTLVVVLALAQVLLGAGVLLSKAYEQWRAEKLLEAKQAPPRGWICVQADRPKQARRLWNPLDTTPKLPR